MDNESYHSLKLLAAACLAICGVAVMAAGIGMAGVPLRHPVCVSLAPAVCCSPAAQLMAAMPPAVAVPALRAVRTAID